MTNTSTLKAHLESEGYIVSLQCAVGDYSVQGRAFTKMNLISVQYTTDVDDSVIYAALLHEYAHFLTETDWSLYRTNPVYRLKLEVTVWRRARQLHQEYTGVDFNEQQEAFVTLAITSYQKWRKRTN